MRPMNLADSIIAATALLHRLPLVMRKRHNSRAGTNTKLAGNREVVEKNEGQ